MKKMKCLTDSEIQYLIDNELNPAEKTTVEQHIEQCEKCRIRLAEQKQFVEFFKANGLITAKTPVQIPAFQAPFNEKRTKIKTIPLWLKIAAILVPTLLIWNFFPQNEPVQAQFTPTAEQIGIYENLHEVDANTAFQQKMVFVTVGTIDN